MEHKEAEEVQKRQGQRGVNAEKAYAGGQDGPTPFPALMPASCGQRDRHAPLAREDDFHREPVEHTPSSCRTPAHEPFATHIPPGFTSIPLSERGHPAHRRRPSTPRTSDPTPSSDKLESQTDRDHEPDRIPEQEQGEIQYQEQGQDEDEASLPTSPNRMIIRLGPFYRVPYTSPSSTRPEASSGSAPSSPSRTRIHRLNRQEGSAGQLTPSSAPSAPSVPSTPSTPSDNLGWAFASGYAPTADMAARALARGIAERAAGAFWPRGMVKGVAAEAIAGHEAPVGPAMDWRLAGLSGSHEPDYSPAGGAGGISPTSSSSSSDSPATPSRADLSSAYRPQIATTRLTSPGSTVDAYFRASVGMPPPEEISPKAVDKGKHDSEPASTWSPDEERAHTATSDLKLGSPVEIPDQYSGSSRPLARHRGLAMEVGSLQLPRRNIRSSVSGPGPERPERPVTSEAVRFWPVVTPGAYIHNVRHTGAACKEVGPTPRINEDASAAFSTTRAQTRHDADEVVSSSAVHPETRGWPYQSDAVNSADTRRTGALKYWKIGNAEGDVQARINRPNTPRSTPAGYWYDTHLPRSDLGRAASPRMSFTGAAGIYTSASHIPGGSASPCSGQPAGSGVFGVTNDDLCSLRTPPIRTPGGAAGDGSGLDTGSSSVVTAVLGTPFTSNHPEGDDMGLAEASRASAEMTKVESSGSASTYQKMPRHGQERGSRDRDDSHSLTP